MTMVLDPNAGITFPDSSIQIKSFAPTGAQLNFFGTVAPAGFVMASGRTIGNAASGALERANADTLLLYTLLWNSMTNAEAAVSSGRGASAAADFAANKTIALPDLRGRTSVGKDDMGGTAASRLTVGGAGITGTTLGAAGGVESVALTVAQLAAHTHASQQMGSGLNGSITQTGGTLGVVGDGGYNVLGSTGSGAAHNNTQPSYVINKIIAL